MRWWPTCSTSCWNVTGGSGSTRPRPACSPTAKAGWSGPWSPTRDASCGSAPGAASCWPAADSPPARSGGPSTCPAPPRSTPAPAEGSTGDTLSLAQAVGGTLSEPRDDNAFWFPSSIGRRKDGSTAVFPHIWDRAKPGIVAVNADGRRFVDESVSYHRFTRAMYESNRTTPTVPAWLVIDSRALDRYGLGMIRPKLPRGFLRKYLRVRIPAPRGEHPRTGRRDRRRPGRSGAHSRRQQPVRPHRRGHRIRQGHQPVRPAVRRPEAPAERQSRADRDGAVLRDGACAHPARYRAGPAHQRRRAGAGRAGRPDSGPVCVRERRRLDERVRIPRRRLPGRRRPDLRLRRRPARGQLRRITATARAHLDTTVEIS